MCLALPWEVIERVVDHSSNSIRTLYSFTLTCRQLYPRSITLLLHRVEFKKRDQILDLCAVLQAQPHLQSYVRSVSIVADDFSPHPLLRLLPHLSEINVYRPEDHRLFSNRHGVLFHSSVLRYCRQFGQHIQTLSLQLMRFRSLFDFYAILSSFSKIRSLSCWAVNIQNGGKHNEALREAQEKLSTRLSERLHLRTLSIDVFGSIEVLTLLVEAEKHSLATLTYTDGLHGAGSAHADELFLTAPPSSWVQLTSFTWKTYLGLGVSNSIGNDPVASTAGVYLERVIEVLTGFHTTNLREVTVVFEYEAHKLPELIATTLPSITALLSLLENSLTTFPSPTILFSPRRPSHNNGRKYHSWMQMLGGFFPVMSGLGALRMDAELWNAGHDGWILTPIVTSADSRWAATGSEDCTIIIWDLENRCISQEWFIEDYAGVHFLAFSPDSQYIMSVGSKAATKGQEATIWALHVEGHGGRKVLSLMGEDFGGSLAHNSLNNIRCMWSSDGRWIAAGPQSDGSTHIWETTTFHRLHLHAHWEGQPLAISSDGHWLVTAGKRLISDPKLSFPKSQARVWNVESGELHWHFLDSEDEQVYAAAFDQGSRLIATGSRDGTTRIWDLENREQLLVLKQPMQGPGRVDAVALSADGGMVLSHLRLLADNPVLSLDRVAVWDTSNGALLISLDSKECYDGGSALHSIGSRHSACFSPCGSYVAWGTHGGQVTLWRISDRSCIAKVSVGRVLVTHVAFSPDGRMLCCGTREGTVFFRRMHDLISGASQD